MEILTGTLLAKGKIIVQRQDDKFEKNKSEDMVKNNYKKTGIASGRGMRGHKIRGTYGQSENRVN